MNDCSGSPAEEYLERYLKGSLPELQARSFEEHYFECPVCLAQVEALEAVTLKLAVEPKARVRELRAKRPVLWPYRVAEAIAAMLVLGLLTWGTVHLIQRKPAANVAVNVQPAPSTAAPHVTASTLTALADTSLPRFEASHLRGADDSSDFTKGMQAYSKHDCTTAVDSLVRVPREDHDYLAAQFYTGLCQMTLKQLTTAAATLHGVAYRGDSPQQEAAYYYLAQVELESNAVADAEQDLVRTIVLHGDFEHRATAEVQKLRSAPSY